MSKQSQSNAGSQSAKRRPPGDQKSGAARWQPFLLIGGVVAIALVAFLLVSTRGSSAPSDPSILALASANAGGGEIKVLTGSKHTVYHSTAPLPTSAAPRADGRPTLVWFSGTFCEFCEQMEPFAHPTAAKFTDRAAFVEKSVDDDRNAVAQYGVRGTPTFVLIDARGREISRFSFQPTEQAFSAAIESALSRVS